MRQYLIGGSNMNNLLVVFLVSALSTSFAAFERSGHGAKGAALGGASIAMKGNIWGLCSNPALGVEIPERVVSLDVVPDRFGLKELAETGILWIEPTSLGAFAVSGTRLGFELYREFTAAASYALKVSKDAALGCTMTISSLTIAGYGSDNAIGVDVGGVVELSRSLRWGFATYNINGAAIGEAKERLPRGYLVGLAYHPIDDLTVATEVQKDIRNPGEVRVGVEYSLMDLVSLRCGTSQDPSTVTAGIGVVYSAFEMDYAFVHHSPLGVTHHFSFSIRPGGF